VARRRLDTELVRRGLVTSRTEAKEAVDAGLVTVAGRPVTKAGSLVGPDEALLVADEVRRYVSRGGSKLEPALARFAIAATGRGCLDAGASTGGFTDALLRAGAAHVVAIDVGYGQLAWSLRTDDRVTIYERTNIRDVTVDMLPYRPSLVVADLSFIPLAVVVPALVRLATADATFVVLVKPQFEAGPNDVGRGGVVRDPDVWKRSIRTVADAFTSAGGVALDVMASPLPGPAGNVEFLLHAVAGAPARVDTGPLAETALSAALDEGRRLAG
jgi:23S rRNA (cytidine1920-2'-O)/16S rRNA (cytidine1409-2'-O)-methyltransferase